MNALITPSYRLKTSDSGFIVEALVTVDPTLAPNFEKRLAANPALDVSVRQEWRDDKYYSLSVDGLSHAIRYAVLREAAKCDVMTITGYLAVIKRLMDGVSAAIDGLFAYVAPEPEFYGELDAVDVGGTEYPTAS
jgi:hypothetical protein